MMKIPNANKSHQHPKAWPDALQGSWWQYLQAAHPLAFEASVFSIYFNFNWLHINPQSRICCRSGRLESIQTGNSPAIGWLTRERDRFQQTNTEHPRSRRILEETYDTPKVLHVRQQYGQEHVMELLFLRQLAFLQVHQISDFPMCKRSSSEQDFPRREEELRN